MSRAFSLRVSLAAAVALPWLTLAPGLSAAAAPPSSSAPVVEPAPAAAAASSSPALKVWIDAGEQPFDAAALRLSLARELKREVVLEPKAAAADVTIRLESAGRAQVRYATPSGEELSRAVELPADSARSVEVLSWLTTNLVRNEAAELLDELRARRKEQQAAELAAANAKAAAQAAADAAQRAAAKPVVAVPAPAPPAAKSGDLSPRELSHRFDLSLATPLGLRPDAARRELFLELSAGYADVGALRGVGFSLGGLRVRQAAHGVAFGLAFVDVNGELRGVVNSVGYSQVNGALDGIQIGAGAALLEGAGRGAMVSVGAAIAGQAFDGLLIGGGLTFARSLRGAGVSAGVIALRQPSAGLLLSGGVNLASDLDGLQIGGGLNVARDLSGAAVAPLNVQRNVKGLQLGVVNVAERVDGAAIGVLSLAGNGRVQPTFWGQSDGSGHLGLKSIAGYAFTQLGGGVDLEANEYTLDGGVGAHLPIGRFFLEPGIHYSYAADLDSAGQAVHQDLHYLAQFGLRLGSELDLLAGLGLQHGIVGTTADELSPEARLGMSFF